AGQRSITKRIVKRSGRIVKKRFKAKRIIIVASRVAEQSERACRRIGATSGVSKKGSSTRRRIFIDRIEQECSGAVGGVKVACGITFECKQANCGIVLSRGKV